jgi:hypothetical protein
MHTYIYTYMHTYIHTYMHIYIHTAAAYPPNWPNAQNVGTYIPSNTGPYFVTGQSFGQTETEITREKESENGANSGNAAARRKTPKWEQRVKKFFGAAEKEEEDAGLKWVFMYVFMYVMYAQKGFGAGEKEEEGEGLKWVFMYVCMCVCMYVYKVCMHVCMHVCI